MSEDVAALLDEVRVQARSQGIRWTRQREAIVRCFLEGSDHVTVDELSDRVARRESGVSTATVYRTMNLLVGIGFAHKRFFGEGSAIFEPAVGKHHHDHLVCRSCGKIVEFVVDEIEDLQEQVARRHGFRLLSHRLNLYGICADCDAKGIGPEDLHGDRRDVADMAPPRR